MDHQRFELFFTIEEKRSLTFLCSIFFFDDARKDVILRRSRERSSNDCWWYFDNHNIERKKRKRMTANQSNEIHLIKHHIGVRERERMDLTCPFFLLMLMSVLFAHNRAHSSLNFFSFSAQAFVRLARALVLFSSSKRTKSKRAVEREREKKPPPFTHRILLSMRCV